MIEGEDQERFKSAVLKYFNAWRTGSLKTQAEEVQKYSRKNITKELIELF